jgi:TonB family protein
VGPHHAQFQFSSRNAGASNPEREVIEVTAERDEDIQRAVARKMTDVIRQYQKGDFWWESYRLGRVVVLSARMEDSIEAILNYRFEPLLTQTRDLAPRRYRQSFNFGPTGIDERLSQYKFPEKSDHLPAEFQYDTPPAVKVVAPVVYPLNLLQDNISGSAKVTVIIDPDGNVRKVEILEATHPEFGFATRGMMHSWEFKPATKNGKRTWAIFALEQKFGRNVESTELSRSATEILKNLKNQSQNIHATAALDSLPVAL